MVFTGTLARIPPLAVRPELTDDDVMWLNGQLALCDSPRVEYVRALPPPPPIPVLLDPTIVTGIAPGAE